MARHQFEPQLYHTAIGSHEPVLHIADGDSVSTATVDAGGHDAANESVTPGGNPQTGPFYIEGAEPGDSIAVLEARRRVQDRTLEEATGDRTFARFQVAEHRRDLGPVLEEVFREERDDLVAHNLVDIGSRTARRKVGMTDLMLPVV